MKLYLTILFNMFALHGYVPVAFCQATIPLVKCKSGDLTDTNNYRAIALSNAITKILELLLFCYIDSYDSADEYQFGFKKNHSTSSCTYVKEIVDYYRHHGSHVFACFIDFSKAFDNVEFWLLFCKLLDNDSSSKRYVAIRLLAYWYDNQQMFIRWQNVSSEPFRVFNGVTQGKVAYYHRTFFVFTALHAMQTRSSDENSVRLSVCPSVCPSVYLSVCHTRVL